MLGSTRKAAAWWTAAIVVICGISLVAGHGQNALIDLKVYRVGGLTWLHGLPLYDPGGGWLYGSLGLLWSIDLTGHWIAVGTMDVRHLEGDAAGSPLVERGTNLYISAGLAWRFGQGRRR